MAWTWKGSLKTDCSICSHTSHFNSSLACFIIRASHVAFRLCENVDSRTVLPPKMRQTLLDDTVPVMTMEHMSSRKSYPINMVILTNRFIVLVPPERPCQVQLLCYLITLKCEYYSYAIICQAWLLYFSKELIFKKKMSWYRADFMNLVGRAQMNRIH